MNKKVQKLLEELGSAAAKPSGVEHREGKSLKVSFGNSTVYSSGVHQQAEEVEAPIIESYTRAQLLSLFETLELDTRKYTFEYLAEQLGFVAKEFLNESTGKKVVLYEGAFKKVWDAAKKAWILVPIMAGAIVSSQIGQAAVNDRMNQRYTELYNNEIMANAKDINKLDPDFINSDEGKRLQTTYSPLVVRGWTDDGSVPKGLQRFGNASNKLELDNNTLVKLPQGKVIDPKVAKEIYDNLRYYRGNDERDVEVGAYGGAALGAALTGAGISTAALAKKKKEEKIPLSQGYEAVMDESYTRKDLQELFEALNLDTDKYTFGYLAEQLGFEVVRPNILESLKRR